MKRILIMVVAGVISACSGSQPPFLNATTHVSSATSNGMIAFARRIPGRESSWTLMTVNPDGSGETVIAHDASHPVWSPDGNSLAYEDNLGRIVVWDEDGTRTPLTDAYTRGAAWSPDGKKIAYIQYTPENGVGTLMTINRDRSGMTPVTVAGVPVTATVTAAWAPNADIAAVAGLDCGGGFKLWGIYVINASGCFSVANNLGLGNPDVALVKNLSWSYRGELAFVYWAIEDPSARPAILKAGYTAGPSRWDTTSVRIGVDPRLGAAPDPDAAIWSPFGDLLAVKAGQLKDEGNTLVERGAPRVYVINDSGGSPRQVTDPNPTNDPASLTYDDVPSWQPCVEGVTTVCRSSASSPWGQSAPAAASTAIIVVPGLTEKQPFSAPGSNCAIPGAFGDLAPFLAKKGLLVFTAPMRFGDHTVAPCALPAPQPNDYIDSRDFLAPNGARLARFVRFLHESYGVNKVSFVGHSYGGLWSRSAVNLIERERALFPDVQVEQVVTIGTPHEGSFGADAAMGLIDADCPPLPLGAVCTAVQLAVLAAVDSMYGLPAVHDLTHDFLTNWAPVMSDVDGSGGCVPVTPLIGDGINQAQILGLDLPPGTRDLVLAALSATGPYVYPNDGIVGDQSAAAVHLLGLHNLRPAQRFATAVHNSIFARFGLVSETHLPALEQAVFTRITSATPHTCSGLLSRGERTTTASPKRAGAAPPAKPSTARAPFHELDAASSAGTLQAGHAGDSLVVVRGTTVTCAGHPLVLWPLLGDDAIQYSPAPVCPQPLEVRGKHAGVVLERVEKQSLLELRGHRGSVTVRVLGPLRTRPLTVQLGRGRRWVRVRRTSGGVVYLRQHGVISIRAIVALPKRQRAIATATVTLP